MSDTASGHLRIAEVDSLEVLSLVDNSIDFLSTIDNENAQSLSQWTRKLHGQEWTRTHSQLPLAEHGFSMLIRVFNKEKSESVLFDTGGSSEAVCANAQRMGVDLSEVGCIVLSHGHYDHFGGLLTAIKAIGKIDLPIIVHDDMFKTRGTAYHDGVVRKYSEFPTKEQLSPSLVMSTKKPTLVGDGMVCITGEIPRHTSFEKGLVNQRCLINGCWQPDPWILDDRAIVINVKGKGLVVLSGCAHAGIINTVHYAQKITEISNVYAIMGGFHLAGKENENKIEQTVSELKRVSPKLIVPSHCTGWRGTFAIANAMPNIFAWNSVGNLYTF
ncbi:MAG TPA: MBL fold metallo-hydrolase [Candidatus Nanoarchaeia archaeon]|nr:MBL fold metallo-hydrolase [Candidatus Nanoarchaeia archaeon]